MPAPSLRNASGRALTSDKNVRIVGFISSSVYIPPTPRTSIYAQSQKGQKARGICSDLGTSFPSIHAARRTLSAARKSGRLQEYLAAAEVFLHCATTVVDQMLDLPNIDETDPHFISAMSTLLSDGAYFVASISNLHSVQAHQIEDGINESYKFVRLLYDSMSDLLGAAFRSTLKTKPLPELLPEFTLQVVEEPQSSPESPSSNSSLSSFEDLDELTSLIDIHVSNDKDSKPIKHRITWQIPKCSLNLSNSKASIFSFRSFMSLASKSSVTMVPPDDIKHTKLPSCADVEPSCPSTSHDGICGTGEITALSFDAQGKIKGGSLPALIAVLTSSQGVTDHELAAVVYTYFRCFTTPTLLFQELAKRYEKSQPTDLTDDQARVWETNISIVRIRVAKAILDWLEQYWRAESDDEILKDIQIFTEERVEIPGHPKVILLQVLEKIDHMKRVSSEDAHAKRVQELVARAELEMPQESAIPTGFVFPERFSRDLVVQLQQFNNAAGREEFARQLAIKLSSMFHDVDPVDAVAYWRPSQKKNHNDAIMNSATSKVIKAITMFEVFLTVWVSYTIIKPKEPLDRACMASFWLDIAMICLRLRNFNSANCIFGGVAHSSVTRMKETILNVSITSKAQFRHLSNFFSGYGNYSQCRAAMDKTMTPTLPLTAPFVRDVIAADILLSLADKEDQTRTDEGATETEYIHLSPYRIMMQTIRTLGNYLIPYKFEKNERFQTWLDAQLSRFTFSNPQEEESMNQNIYDRSNKREPKNAELQFVRDVWEHTISGSLDDGPYTITRCSEETLQVVPQVQRVRAKSLRLLLSCRKSS